MTAERLDSLAAIERACWDELARAMREQGHAWRVMTLATVDAGRADARAVVVREVDPTARTLRFYTDARSPKVQQLRARPDGVLLAWSPALGWQLRMPVRLALEPDADVLAAHWAGVESIGATNDYRAAQPPGTPVAHHAPERGDRAHFALVRAEVMALDWLELHPLWHRRARFEGGASSWLTP
jgi:hypothetical protein